MVAKISADEDNVKKPLPFVSSHQFNRESLKKSDRCLDGLGEYT